MRISLINIIFVLLALSSCVSGISGEQHDDDSADADNATDGGFLVPDSFSAPPYQYADGTQATPSGSSGGADQDASSGAQTESPEPLWQLSDETEILEYEKPQWASEAVASAQFVRPSGAIYSLLVFSKEPGEALSAWMKNSPVGDAYISAITVQTADGAAGYVYVTNDFGAKPDAHITVPTDAFVYYFHTDTETFEIPVDFTEFIEGLMLE